jgi:hypothetical protein
MNKLKQVYQDYYKFPAYILSHPIDGFDQLKRYKKGKLSVAITLLFMTCLLNVLTYQYSGFLVNNNNPQYLNSIREISIVVIAVLLVSVGNWSITTLLDGKGKFKEIFMMVCYSLFPLVLLGFPNILLSNIYTGKEVSFYYVLDTIAVVLLVFLIFMGFLVIHDYSVLRTVLTVVLTIVAISVILFICLLFFSLAQQMLGFIIGLYEEFSWKYL